MHYFLMLVGLMACVPNNYAADIKISSPAQIHQVFVRDQVVQVIAFKYEFNWFEPYKKGSLMGSSGTAFSISPQGDYYTNFHVVKNAHAIFLQHPALGKERFEAEFVGGSPDYDIAHICVKPLELERMKQLLNVTELPYLRLGDSDKVCPGDPVTLIGYPLGHEEIKRTTGIISGQQSMPSLGECLTITAAANPGNSGGPCVNGQGEVIGVLVAGAVVQRMGSTYAAEGYHFILPINRLLAVWDLLKDGRIIELPYFGFTYTPLTQTTLSYLQVPEKNGVYITKVFPESIAALAGLKQGDVLAGFNDLTIDRFGFVNAPWTTYKISLFDLLARCHDHQKVQFILYRGGEKVIVPGAITFASPLKISYKYPPLQTPPAYLVFGGMIIMEATKNHLDLVKEELATFVAQDELDVVKFLSPQQHYFSKLLITHIFPETEISKNRVITRFGARAIIKSVNNMLVTTVQDFEQAVLAGASTGSVVIETYDNTLFALSLKDIIATDMLLAPKHGYPLSALIQKLALMPSAKSSTP